MIIQVLAITFLSDIARSSIAGLSYMDPINQRPLEGIRPRGEDPCNPLYWYPRRMPDYCYAIKKPDIPEPPPVPLYPFPPSPMPSEPNPVPIAIPLPLPLPLPLTLPFPSPYGMNPMPSIPLQHYMAPGYPAYSPALKAGFMPGLPGLVSPDGGINIAPFSDVYSDLLEKHKQKIIRKRLQLILDDYDDFERRKRRYKYL